MDEDNDRQNLYDEFESEVVRHGNQEAYFDENDLIEIFDYASDLDNNIVKMEVLIYGAVHYPRSEALATRRAWFYSSFGDFETATEINRRVNKGGVLNRVLDLRVSLPANSPEVEPRLEQIVADTDDFGDEEIIQLVDFCMETGREEWLTERKQLIQSKCSYPQTFLYEFADRAEEAENYALAADLFEELTMLEPFTLDFWQRLATVQINMDLYEAALQSADYALAIDPKAMMAARIKGAALYRLDRDMATVAELYTRILESNEAEDSDASTLAAALVELNRQPEAIEMLKKYIPAHYNPRLALNILLVLDRPSAAPLVESLIRETVMSESSAMDWAKEHVEREQYMAAATILLTYHRLHGLLLGYEFTFEVCYYAGLYDEIIYMFEHEIYSKLIDSPIPSISFPYIMSLVRTGNREKALATANEALSKSRDFLRKYTGSHESWRNTVKYTPVTTNAIITGHMTILGNIIKALGSTDRLEADDFDPMLSLNGDI
ncbi:MAG: hypothetical protein K2O30_04980 [Duncaniella sp.]|nr:hypothetical protein [Duncaniella sp.]MDE7145488.1 hypothetical protein [Duncaniella sp.]